MQGVGASGVGEGDAERREFVMALMAQARMDDGAGVGSAIQAR